MLSADREAHFAQFLFACVPG